MNAPRRIETPRLVLRKPRAGDARAIFAEYASDPDATRYLLFRPHAALEESRAFLAARLARWGAGREICWAITVKPSDRLVGMIGCGFDPQGASLGYVLARRLWGRGYMSEAVTAVADWALAQDGLHRVWAVCDTANLGSARVMEKAGMTREGTLRRWLAFPNLPGPPRDCFVYSRVR